MSLISKTPQPINTSQDPALEYLNQREITTAITPTENSTKKVIYEQVTQVVTNVIQVNGPQGADGAIQFNENGSYVGDSGLQFESTTDTLTTGKVVANTVTISGNLKLSGGYNRNFLTTDGTGNTSWADVLPSRVGNSGKFLVTNGVAESWSTISYSSFATQTDVANAVSNLVGAAPGILDTLAEIANVIGATDNPEFSIVSQLANKANITNLADVAFSGSYTDLAYKPTISTAGQTGNYEDIHNKPTIPVTIMDLGISDGTLGQVLTANGNGTYHFTTVTSSGGTLTSADLTWANVSGKPTFATVATTGSYTDLSNKPALFDGAYSSLTGTPTSVSNLDSLSDVVITTAATGQVLKYDGTNWVNDTDSTGSSASTGNITFADNTLTGTGDVKIHFTPSASPAVEFNFASNGSLTLPGTLNVAGGDAPSITGPDGIKISTADGKQLMLDWQAPAVNPYPGVPQLSTSVALVNLGYSGVVIEVNSADGGGYWTFGPTGQLKLPPGGDIVDTDGVSVFGVNSFDQSLNTTDSVTFNQVTPTELRQNSSRTVSTISVTVPGATPTVVYSAPSFYTSIKLVIAVEGQLDGDVTNVRHTQTCEATIAATYNTTAEPIISVYGIVYTSSAPLATFTVARNILAGTIEVTAINSQTTNALDVRVHAIQFVSTYD